MTNKTEAQPEALRLANWIDSDFDPDEMLENGYDAIAAELRRLQDENARQRCSIEALAARRNTMSDRIAQLEAERDALEKELIEQSRIIGMSAERELALRAQLAQRQAPDGWVMVPREFVAGFGTLAHNYSLTVIPPDRYWGTERDAFRNAYTQCGADLAELKAMLAASPTPPQRVVLSAKEVGGLLESAGYWPAEATRRADFINGLRYGEMAHGIKGEDDGK